MERQINWRKKIALWGSITSVVSVIALLIPQSSISENQISYGANSTNIKAKGNISINYDNTPKNTQSYYYVFPPYGSDGTDLLTKPNFINVSIICSPEPNSKINIIDRQNNNLAIVWVKVKVITGTCINKVGWISQGHIRIYNG